jgi:hypothetical protein
MQCRNHPKVAATDRCKGCAESFCPKCLVPVQGHNYCATCKMTVVEGPPPPPTSREILSEAKNALLMAIVGLFCCGLLEFMALSKASEARKLLDADPRLDGRSMVTAAQVIAIAGIAFWVLSMVVHYLARAVA